MRKLSTLVALLVTMMFAATALAQSVTGDTVIFPAEPANSQSGTSASKNETQNPSQGLVISAGDLLEVGIYGTDFSCGPEKAAACQVRVSDSGEISLPFIGAVKISGMTIAQAEQVIGKRLSEGDYFNDPQVIILQKEYATQGISVLGEVQKPGIYNLLGSHTLLEAISAAGGTTVKAGNEVVIMHKNSPNSPQNVNLKKPESANVPLSPGDSIVVTKAGIVYVVGDVKQPSGLVMESSGLTILQAISMAQGTNPTAALDSARLIRTTPEGRKEIPVSLKNILASKSPDLQLQPQDILFVPASAAKGAARRSMDAILQIATGVAIYRR